MSDYVEQKRQAWDPDPLVRKALAANPGTLPEILYFLAEDEAPMVRHQVAMNDFAPRHADLLLARDNITEIRSDLAVKIARLTPNLPEEHRTALFEMTERTLETLARDQMVRVREILANALKNHPGAPSSVILTLAKDTSLTVSSPIVEYSPVLSDQDLLAIIKSRPIQGVMTAIARRVALDEDVSDAIAHSEDDDAIASLLGNKSVQLREDTLDFIIDRAPEKVQWHEPLVMRPNLNSSAARRIGSFIAKKLLDRLRQRDDLAEETLSAIEAVVERRLEEHSDKAQPDPQWADEDDLEEQVARMLMQEELTLEVLEEALAAGKRRFVVLAIAKMADLSSEAMSRIIASRSAKAIVSLTWNAQLTPHFSIQLQTQLIGLSPKELLRSPSEEWPMSPAAMQWQIEFYRQSH